MGMKAASRKPQSSPAPSRTSLADALFSTTQQRRLEKLARDAGRTPQAMLLRCWLGWTSGV
jgi:hypothetical protein